MPYIVDEGQIRTKLLGVKFKFEDIGRQQLLMILRDAPQTIDNMYLLGTTCFISYDGKEYVLGTIREEYGTLLRTHDVEILHYEVTGGYEIVKGENLPETAALGCNIILKLTKPAVRTKPVVIQEKMPTAHGEGTTITEGKIASTKECFAI